MGKWYETLRKNWRYIALVAIVICGVWLYHDARRNDRIYNDTEATVDAIGERINSAGERVNSAKERVTEAQEAVGTATERVTAGAELATEIADAVTECERRADEALQRNGRIKNIIAEIKRTAK